MRPSTCQRHHNSTDPFQDAFHRVLLVPLTLITVCCPGNSLPVKRQQRIIQVCCCWWWCCATAGMWFTPLKYTPALTHRAVGSDQTTVDGWASSGHVMCASMNVSARMHPQESCRCVAVVTVIMSLLLQAACNISSTPVRACPCPAQHGVICSSIPDHQASLNPNSSMQWATSLPPSPAAAAAAHLCGL